MKTYIAIDYLDVPLMVECWIEPERPATRDDPAEGGVTIENIRVRCSHKGCHDQDCGTSISYLLGELWVQADIQRRVEKQLQWHHAVDEEECRHWHETVEECRHWETP